MNEPTSLYRTFRTPVRVPSFPTLFRPPAPFCSFLLSLCERFATRFCFDSNIRLRRDDTTRRWSWWTSLCEIDPVHKSNTTLREYRNDPVYNQSVNYSGGNNVKGNEQIESLPYPSRWMRNDLCSEESKSPKFSIDIRSTLLSPDF